MTDSLRSDDQASPEHCACQIIRDYDIAVVVYTDCSATEGTRNSGAAMVVTTRDPAYPVIIQSEERRVQPSLRRSTWRKRPCPWLSVRSLDKVFICSDSQSLLCAVVSGADSAVNIINLIQQSPTDIHVQWVLDTVVYSATSLQTNMPSKQLPSRMTHRI